MRRDVRVEIVRDKIIVPMVGDGTAQGAESAGVAKRVGFDGVEDFRKVRVQRKGAEVVGVAKVFDVFGEIAEEEDVGVANLARYLNLFLRGRVILLCVIRRDTLWGGDKGGIGVCGQERKILTFAPSQVPIIRPPLRTNFMLLVPLASVPAVEMCSLRSEAGTMISALLTL